MRVLFNGSHNSMYQLHAGLNRLAQGTNVTYGSVFFALDNLVGFGDNSPLFHSVPDNIGFYGVDVYGHVGLQRGMDRLETFIQGAKAKDTITPGYPRLLIAETNTPVNPVPCSPSPCTPTPPAPRTGGIGVGWYETVCNRMHQYGTNSIGVLTFWKTTGELSGPWDPSLAPTFNTIIDTIF